MLRLHCVAARGGWYYFEIADGSDGTTVRLFAWLGEPLQWSTYGDVGRDERADLLALGYDPAALLIDGLMA